MNTGTPVSAPGLVLAGAASPAARALVELARERGWKIAVFSDPHESWGILADTPTYPVDLSDAQAVEECFARVTLIWGHPASALVYFATSDSPDARARLAVTESADGWEATQSHHLLSGFLFAQSGAREMLRLRGGQQVEDGAVVLVVDVGVAHSAPGFGTASMSAAVGGLAGTARQLAVEWGPFGIRVNTVHLGITEGLTGRGAELLRRVPLARVADPRELAESCYYLMSRASSYVTGAVLPVDGGYHAS